MKSLKTKLLILSRGLPLGEIDTKGSLCVFLSVNPIVERPRFATWMALNPESSTGTLLSPQSTTLETFDLKPVGKHRLLKVPDAICHKLNLPVISCWNGDGILESSQTERILNSTFQDSPCVFAGGTLWKSHSFSASPMGVRVGKNLWTTFVPAGPNVAIELNGLEFDNKGMGLNDSHAANHLEVLTSLTRQRFPNRVSESLYCHCQSFEDALTLVILRRAWGSLPSINIPRDMHPGWRRLIQHLGRTPTAVAKPAGDLLRSFSALIPLTSKETLLRELSVHSRLIPDDLAAIF